MVVFVACDGDLVCLGCGMGLGLGGFVVVCYDVVWFVYLLMVYLIVVGWSLVKCSVDDVLGVVGCDCFCL